MKSTKQNETTTHQLQKVIQDVPVETLLLKDEMNAIADQFIDLLYNKDDGLSCAIVSAAAKKLGQLTTHIDFSTKYEYPIPEKEILRTKHALAGLVDGSVAPQQVQADCRMSAVKINRTRLALRFGKKIKMLPSV